MDKNEVITLSSDEECDVSQTFQKNLNTPKSLNSEPTNSPQVLKTCLEKFKQISVDTRKGIIIHNNKHEVKIVRLSSLPEKKPTVVSKDSPEVVVLEGSSAKTTDSEPVQLHCTNDKSLKSDKNNSKTDIIDIVELPSEDNLLSNELTKSAEINEVVSNDATNCDSKHKNTDAKLQTETLKQADTESSDQNLKFYTEFVDHCSSLEEIASDRARLTKKLMKRYGEADGVYIKSKEFQNLVKKCRSKVNKNNLYLVAKEITDELSYRKKTENNTGKSNVSDEKCQRDQETVDKKEIPNQQSKKRTKVIKKIIKKLDKLGGKIRELEEKEVDLSDEEESSYVQLQRYRERFWQIYKKLCQYTNEVADADRVYNRKICFTESKYPAINKCIENYLNKTRQFPDFSDIMKLLESQSTSLDLPSNKESLRAIAIEIFQQVGVMLQRRRKYDLWDSFCGFLDEGVDPADNDPILDKVLKSNYDIRIKKEQEIFQHFTELQEKERLEPEEVPDEEANRSPVDSGNEDEKEIADIENSLNRRLDNEIKKDTENNAVNDLEGNQYAMETPKEGHLTRGKETKNNYRNCKSLKWKLENGVKVKSDNPNSEDSNTGAEIEEKETTGKLEADDNHVIELKRENMNHRLENKLVKLVSSEIDIHRELKVEAIRCNDSPLKRHRSFNNEELPTKKICTMQNEIEGNSFNIFEVDDQDEIKRNEVFEVHCCQIVPNNIFEDLSESKKDWGKRKVFRDLTNVNRLMELHGRKRKMSGLYSPSFFHRSFFEFENPSWKKRFKVSYKLVGVKGEKCALSQEDKTEKTVNANSGGGEKDIQNNSERTGEDDDAGNSFSSRGNGNEEDNNGDENKKNGKTGDEPNDHQHEEDEEEENENEKKDDLEDDVKENENEKKGKKENGVEEIENEKKGEKEDDVEENENEKKGEKQNGVEEIENEKKGDLEDDVEENENEKKGEKQNGVEENEKKGEKEDDVEENENEKKCEKQNGVEEIENEKKGEKEDDIEENENEKEGKKIENHKMETESSETTLPTEKTEETSENESSSMNKQDISFENNGEDEKESSEDPKTVEETELVCSKETVECIINELPDNEGKEKMFDRVNLKTENENPIGEWTPELEPKVCITETESEAEKPEEEIKDKKQEDGNSEAQTQSDNKKLDAKCKNRRNTSEKINTFRVTRQRLRQAAVTENTNKPVFTESTKPEKQKRRSVEITKTTIRKSIQSDSSGVTPNRRNTPSTSDEERVKRFLLHSPSSISITPPRKLSLSKPPSQAALQALATLKNLKGISATIVRGGPPKKEEDVVVIEESNRRRSEPTSNQRKRKRNDLPVISSIQSIGFMTPKIVTVEGNVSGFENFWPEPSNNGDSQNNMSSIRISKVWGSTPNNYPESVQNNVTLTPSCSFRQNNPGSSNSVKRKKAKKTVEYVVLE